LISDLERRSDECHECSNGRKENTHFFLKPATVAELGRALTAGVHRPATRLHIEFITCNHGDGRGVGAA
jgi:hypothetical protein